jgi:Cu/Ag efflux protein CusF
MRAPAQKGAPPSDHQEAMFAGSLRASLKERKVSMGKMLSVFVTVGILSASTVALAAEATHRTTGKIKSVDLMTHVITLENGSTYKVAQGVNIKGMKAGEKVTVTTSGIGGTVEASAITPAVD